MNEVTPSRQRRHTFSRLWKADRRCICWKEEEPRLIPVEDHFSGVGACLACCHQWSGWSFCSEQVLRSFGPCACPVEVSAACRWDHRARQCHKQLPDQQTRHWPSFLPLKILNVLRKQNYLIYGWLSMSKSSLFLWKQGVDYWFDTIVDQSFEDLVRDTE